MIADARAEVSQSTVSVLSEGDPKFVQQGVTGQIWTADWHQRLILAGRVYRMTIGTITGSTSHALVGTGTVIDLDLPEGLIAVDSGYLIPMALNLGLLCNTDLDNQVCEVLLTSDRATGVPSSDVNESTLETPANLLDGADAFQGRAWSLVNTTPITDPVHTDLLYYRMWESLGVSLGPTKFNINEIFKIPTLLAGSGNGCSLLLYFGGTQAVTGMGSLVFAHIPTEWAPIPS